MDDDGQVKVMAQSLTPKTYEVNVDETFTTVVVDGKHKARSFFFIED